MAVDRGDGNLEIGVRGSKENPVWAVWAQPETGTDPYSVDFLYPPITYGVRPPGAFGENAGV